MKQPQELVSIIEDPPENCTARPIDDIKWDHWEGVIFGSVNEILRV